MFSHATPKSSLVLRPPLPIPAHRPPTFASLLLHARPLQSAVPRGEKLLKPLPDKPIPCDKLPDGPEPVQVEVEYPARSELQVGGRAGGGWRGFRAAGG